MLSGVSGAIGFKLDTPFTTLNSPELDNTTLSTLGKYAITSDVVNVLLIGKSEKLVPVKILGLKSKTSDNLMPLNSGIIE